MDHQHVVQVAHLAHRDVHDGLRERGAHGAHDGEHRSRRGRLMRWEQDGRSRHEQHADEGGDTSDQVDVVDGLSEHHSSLHRASLVFEWENSGKVILYQEEGEDRTGEDDDDRVCERHVGHGVEGHAGAHRPDQAAEQEQRAVLSFDEQVGLDVVGVDLAEEVSTWSAVVIMKMRTEFMMRPMIIRQNTIT